MNICPCCAGDAVGVKAACTCDCHKTVSLTRPLLWNHDHMKPVGRVEVVNGKIEFHFNEDLFITHEMLFEIFGNVGLQVTKQEVVAGLVCIRAGQIMEWSLPL